MAANRLTTENSPTTPERHGGGRHLDATRDDVLRRAALELLGTIGYDRLTVDKVAAYAGAGKATIYRRWSGKADLVVDALTCAKSFGEMPDTGTLRGDLAAFARYASTNNGPFDAQVMIGLVSALPHDRELRDVFRERLVEPHVATLTAIFERAVARGEVEPIERLDIVVSIFPALVLHRLLIFGLVPDQSFLESIIDGVIVPLILVGSSAPTPTPPR